MEDEIQEIPLDAAYGEMLYRQDRIYYDTRAAMEEDSPAQAALDAAYVTFKQQMLSCTTTAELEALEATGWLPNH